MPRVLAMSNGRPETILSTKDFEDLIDKHMGMDCANYYQEQIEALSQCIRDLTEYLSSEDGVCDNPAWSGEKIDSYVKQDVEEVLKTYGF